MRIVVDLEDGCTLCPMRYSGRKSPTQSYTACLAKGGRTVPLQGIRVADWCPLRQDAIVIIAKSGEESLLVISGKVEL